MNKQTKQASITKVSSVEQIIIKGTVKICYSTRKLEKKTLVERLEKKLKLKSLFTARKGIYSRSCDSKNKVFSKIDGSEFIGKKCTVVIKRI